MSLGTINFDSAFQFLNTLNSLPNQQMIADEVENLKEYVNELNPANTNVSTLSQHRKAELERRIATLADAIEKKLHPIHLRPSEILQNQWQAIKALSEKLPLSPKELRSTIKNLHPDLKQKIEHAVWMVNGCPKGGISLSEVLNSNPEILQQRFQPFYAPLEGTILEQIASDLAMESERADRKEKIENFNQTGNVPAANQKQIELDQLTLLRDDQKVAIFEHHLNDLKMNHRQLKALFEAMPESVKARLPKPPYLGRGFDTELYKTLGAHFDRNSGQTTFRVYAPHAREITLNLTAWNNIEHSIQMQKKENGVWEAKTQHAPLGRSYHFMIVGPNGGQPFKKVDPFAFGNIFHSVEKSNEEDFESIVCDVEKDFHWTDEGWVKNRVNINPAKTPMSIFEVHCPTWKKRDNGDPLNWKELAPELAAYCKEIGYTHVELMALFEHPQEISMGYHITNFFSLNHKMGSIEDFQYFVNYLHEQGIGVVADWVPAHFSKSKEALRLFDGSPLLEDDNPEYAEHPVWGSYEFDYKKQFTKDFIASNLDFLLKKFHFDAIRVDAVQSVLNYNRDHVDAKAGDINKSAKAFFRNLNTYVHSKYPGTLMIAEEAMGFPNLVRPANEKGQHIRTYGVGFDLTWHMGFTNDILRYLAIPPQYRSSNFGMFVDTLKKIDHSDDFRPRGKVVLPLSHDENANGRGTIYTKMGGNSDDDKFSNGRLLLAYQLLRGGGPVLDFMGNEILQSQEWHGRLINGLTNPTERKKASVQWEELDPSIDVHNYGYHAGARESRKALLRLYRDNPGLQDQSDAGFSWIDAKDSENCVLSFHRRGSGQQFACIFNTSDKDMKDYMIQLPDSSYAPELDRLIGIKEVYNTDDAVFGGQGRLNAHVEIVRNSSNRPTHLKLRLPPYTAIMLQEQFASNPL